MVDVKHPRSSHRPTLRDYTLLPRINTRDYPVHRCMDERVNDWIISMMLFNAEILEVVRIHIVHA